MTRRADKAERRAKNIRAYFPNDPAAERRAQKAERRAKNIRAHAARRQTRGSASENDRSWEIAAGCFAVLVALGGIAWAIGNVAEWFGNLF